MENRHKKLYAALIVLISLFICGVIIWSLYTNKPITSQHVILILLLSIMGLSFSFDKLMLGRLFSIEKNIENVKEQQQELSEENNKIQQDNIHFKQEVFSYMLNSLNQISNQNQNQNTNMNQPITVNATANVLPSENTDPLLAPEIEEDDFDITNAESKDELIQSAELAVPIDEPFNKDQNKKYEREAVNTVAKKLGFNIKKISYGVKIRFSEDTLFRSKIRLYDAFYDSDNMHYFIEVLSAPVSPSLIDGKISDVKKYSDINKIPAKIIIILMYTLNDEYRRKKIVRFHESLSVRLQPAIENNFVTIEIFNIDESQLATKKESAVGKEQ